MSDLSFLDKISPETIEEIYQDFIKNPENVSKDWAYFFSGFEFAFRRYGEGDGETGFSNEIKVLNLIQAYRIRGHLFTRTNPVRTRRKYYPTLDYQNFGLSESHLQQKFAAGRELGLGRATLQEIIDFLQKVYCDTIGYEYQYIRNPEERGWLQERIENPDYRLAFSLGEKKHILFHLLKAVLFERFLHSRFPGQKRFSLEGCEVLIPALDWIIEKSAETGTEEIIIGMAHRGRLNVLTNILNKRYAEVFAEFGKDAYSEEEIFQGDVKYHLGYTNEVVAHNGLMVKLRVVANPSHLEAVNPVVEGLVRAKLDLSYRQNLKKVIPVLIHGDAAIAGQGVNYEVIQMSALDGFRTGGTIHLVINNQIGFTTDYKDARSSTYCTDVAKVTLSPVFHVNADDIEAVLRAVNLAVEYRQRFHKDVFIDLLGYRRHGHNEGDEPRYTQPLLYKAISKHPDPLQIYSKKLIQEKVITESYLKELQQKYTGRLERELQQARKNQVIEVDSYFQNRWKGFQIPSPENFNRYTSTGVSARELIALGQEVFSLPPEIQTFKKVQKIFEQRLDKLLSKKNYDWGIGEILAYATLLKEGYSIRISGQDVERGTFSHRHAVVTDENTGEEYIPLTRINTNGATFQIYNSPLNEFATLGFEFGYSLVEPRVLTIWEAQFGDFSNGAQVIIDQFISSSQTKWQRMNGLVLFLPHGYEGQGPEHSSARPERFLQLCANYNIQVTYPSTPANFFHLLRRQMHRKIRLPLIVFTPKSLLRHPLCVSNLSEFTKGKFKEVLDDPNVSNPEKIKKIIFCTGKIFYDLYKERERRGLKDVALVRLEQLYPFPEKILKNILKKYKAASEYFWVQEEPYNMGFRSYIRDRLEQMVKLRYVHRDENASPATGYIRQHIEEQAQLLSRAFS